MVTVRQSVKFEWSAALVWEYLIAFEQVPRWEHGVLDVRRVTPGEPVVGTKIAARRIYAGVETALDGEIVSMEPGREVTMELRGGPLGRTRVQYAVEPLTATSSIVTYTAFVELRGPLRLLSPVIPALGRQETRRNLDRLRKRIAAGIPPRSDELTPD